jgi:general nucleoside transport system permease protein
VETFINSMVVLATPLLLAAIAGLIAERTGVLNIALEGLILGGAFISAWVAGGHGSVFLGLVVTLVAGLVAGGVYALVVVYMRADQVAVGIAFNLVALGLTSYAFDLITKAHGQSALQTGKMATISIPGLSSIPWIGPIFDQPWLTFVAYPLGPIVWFVLFRTGLGIRARACGEYSEGAQAAGLNVKRWRLGATALSGAIAGAAGAYLVLADTHGFIINMSSGKGYIALAVIILGRWNPIGAIAAAALFGGAQALDFQLQTGSILGLHPPVALIETLPYVVTVVAVAIVGRRVTGPAEDGKPLTLQ